MRCVQVFLYKHYLFKDQFEPGSIVCARPVSAQVVTIFRVSRIDLRFHTVPGTSSHFRAAVIHISFGGREEHTGHSSLYYTFLPSKKLICLKCVTCQMQICIMFVFVHVFPVNSWTLSANHLMVLVFLLALLEVHLGPRRRWVYFLLYIC